MTLVVVQFGGRDTGWPGSGAASGTGARWLPRGNRGAGAGRGAAAGVAGSQTRTLVPWPGADSKVAWPPCAWAMAATMARPSPLPPLSGESPFAFTE